MSTITKSPISKRESRALTLAVARGAVLLDSKKRGWFRRIKSSIIDESWGERSVLGQLYPEGGYRSDISDFDQLIRYGFFLPKSYCHKPHSTIEEHRRNFSRRRHAQDIMSRAWKFEIRRRRKGEL